MIQLDTGFLIRSLLANSPEDLLLREWLRSETAIGISTICWGEFLCGPLKSHQMELAGYVVGEQIPFLTEHAVEAARLFNVGGRRRGSFTDCMIAATALCQGASLATTNAEDFRRFEPIGLKIVSV